MPAYVFWLGLEKKNDGGYIYIMLKILLLVFVFVPLVELYVLIEVGSGIGGLATIALCLFTAALGGLIIRWQGLQTLMQARQSMMTGQQQQLAAHSFHGLMLVIAGVLLFFPGLITDGLGFLLLIPQVRRFIMPKHIRFQTSQAPTSSSHRRYPEVEVVDAEVIKKD